MEFDSLVSRWHQAKEKGLAAETLQFEVHTFAKRIFEDFVKPGSKFQINVKPGWEEIERKGIGFFSMF